MNIIEALEDRALLGSAIKDRSTHAAWWAALKTIFGLPLTDDEAAIYRACTGRQELPAAAFAIAWLVCGRRSGKSLVMSIVAAYQAIFMDWRRFLAPGERACILIVAADKEQSKVVRRYVGGILSTPMFAPHVEAEREESIDLRGSVVIEVATCSYRTVRGRSVCVALLDETCFWRTAETSANPDREVWRAIRASMATFGSEAKAIIASSPYAKKGLLYDGYRRYFGKPDLLNLVWQAGTRTMNPTISDEFLKAEFEADPISAASEYDAAWRNDIAAFLDRDLIVSTVETGLFVRPPKAGTRYIAFADPSGGVGDAFTLAIAHAETSNGVKTAVLDCLIEKHPPFSPSVVCEEMAVTLKEYGLTKVEGDKYAAQWVVEAFRKCGINYVHSERDRSAIFSNTIPLFTTGCVKLLDNKRLVTQFANLERKTSSSGKDRIDHPTGGHDDAANAAAGALTLAAAKSKVLVITDEFLRLCEQPGPRFGDYGPRRIPTYPM